MADNGRQWQTMADLEALCSGGPARKRQEQKACHYYCAKQFSVVQTGPAAVQDRLRKPFWLAGGRCDWPEAARAVHCGPQACPGRVQLRTAGSFLERRHPPVPPGPSCVLLCCVVQSRPSPRNQSRRRRPQEPFPNAEQHSEPPRIAIAPPVASVREKNNGSFCWPRELPFRGGFFVLCQTASPALINCR